MVLPLIQCPTPPKQWNCASPAPPARHTFPPYSLCRGRQFWLVVVLKIIDWQPFKAVVYFTLYIFCQPILRPNRWDGVPARAPHPRSNTPPTGSADYRVDCCLKSSNGGHLRPEPSASFYFFLRPIPTLQLTEPATARTHRTPRACFRPIGSDGAKI